MPPGARQQRPEWGWLGDEPRRVETGRPKSWEDEQTGISQFWRSRFLPVRIWVQRCQTLGLLFRRSEKYYFLKENKCTVKKQNQTAKTYWAKKHSSQVDAASRPVCEAAPDVFLVSSPAPPAISELCPCQCRQTRVLCLWGSRRERPCVMWKGNVSKQSRFLTVFSFQGGRKVEFPTDPKVKPYVFYILLPLCLWREYLWASTVQPAWNISAAEGSCPSFHVPPPGWRVMSLALAVTSRQAAVAQRVHCCIALLICSCSY